MAHLIKINDEDDDDDDEDDLNDKFDADKLSSDTSLSDVSFDMRQFAKAIIFAI